MIQSSSVTGYHRLSAHKKCLLGSPQFFWWIPETGLNRLKFPIHFSHSGAGWSRMTWVLSLGSWPCVKLTTGQITLKWQCTSWNYERKVHRLLSPCSVFSSVLYKIYATYAMYNFSSIRTWHMMYYIKKPTVSKSLLELVPTVVKHLFMHLSTVQHKMLHTISVVNWAIFIPRVKVQHAV